MYDKLLSLMTLSPEHREELKVKRGFTDETIERFGFKSAIDPDKAEEIKAELLKDFSEEELKNGKLLLSTEDISKKCTSKAGDLTFTVIGERIVVPFIGDGMCSYLRQHKFGLSGTTPQIYNATRDDEKILILTEGEFKAAALYQLGFSAAASPGISLFGGKNFGLLEEWVHERGVEKVYIMFDGEVKNDPVLYPKQYKKDRRVRHDTDWWAYKLARMLTGSGIETDVVTWPDSWLIDGKIDPDAAIANGKTREDFDALVDNAYNHKQFRKSWTGEKKQVLEQKAKRESFKSDIIEKNGQYFKKVKKGDEFFEVPFTNFTMEIVAKHATRNEETGRIEIIREAKVKSQDGEIEARVDINAAHLTSGIEFKKALMNIGDFQYTGDGGDLVDLVNRLFAEQEVKECQRPVQVGSINEDKFSGFFMGNVAFVDGKTIPSDDDGGFWVNDTYVQPDSYIVGSDPNIVLSPTPFDWNGAINKFCEAYGTLAPKALVLWQVASLFSDTFFNIRGGRGFFPLMYVGGGYKSGKTTVTGFAQNFVGLGKVSQIDLENTTKPGLERTMKFYSSLPVWVDELRADGAYANYEGIFRDMYNRAGGIKATKAGGAQVRRMETNCTLLLSGQETSPDAALNERMIKINFSSADRPKGTDAFKWITRNLGSLSYMSYDLLGRQKDIIEYIKKEYVANTEDLNDKLDNQRVAGNYAVLLTMAEAIGICDEEFEDFLFRIAEASCNESNDMNESVVIFHEMLDIMQEERIPASKYFKRGRGDVVNCGWNKMFGKYKEVKGRRREGVMDKRALMNQLSDGGVMLSTKSCSIDGHMTRGCQLDGTKIPSELIDYIDSNFQRGDF